MSLARRLTRICDRGNAIVPDPVTQWLIILPKIREIPISRNMTDTTHLEEQIAYLAKTVDELSDVVARQEKEIEIAKRRIAMLMEREAGRELDAGGTIPLADQKPPHW